MEAGVRSRGTECVPVPLPGSPPSSSTLTSCGPMVTAWHPRPALEERERPRQLQGRRRGAGRDGKVNGCETGPLASSWGAGAGSRQVRHPPEGASAFRDALRSAGLVGGQVCPELQAPGAPCQQVSARSRGGPLEPLGAPLGGRCRFDFCGCSFPSGEVGETRWTHGGAHVSPGSAGATHPAPLKIPGPYIPEPLGNSL